MAKKIPKKSPIKKKIIAAADVPDEPVDSMVVQSQDDDSAVEEVESDEESDEEIIALGRSRFLLCETSEQENRTLALDDMEFISGNQWPEEMKRSRDVDKRPCLTINKLPAVTRQVCNDQRQNRPSIKVSPVDDGADIDTARVRQGLMRHIWNNSNADVAVDVAFEGAVQKSFGFFRMTTGYVDHMSFDQEILIKQIPNHFSCYLDPSAKEPDGSDAKYGFIIDEVSKDEFEATYPDADTSLMESWSGIGDQVGWYEKGTCRVAEYYRTVYKKVKLVLFDNGVVLEKKPDMVVPKGVKIHREREALVPTIKWVKMTGTQILERADIPGEFVPLIPVYGATLVINGKTIRESLIRHSKDPQRALNYFRSSETEAIGLAPKAPFIVEEGQIPPEYRAQWESANVKNHAFLTYKRTQSGAAPQRNSYEPPVMAITNASAQAADDIKSTTGLYDASLGNKSNETSGVAIERRNHQAQTSNFHFFDNLARSIKHCGKIMDQWIPVIYDAARTIRIIGIDDQEEVIKINQEFKDEKGKAKKHMMRAGKYDVMIETGPNYATRRQEAVSSILELMKTLPMQAPIIADIAVRNMDTPYAKEMSERLKKAVDPKFLDEKDQPAQDDPAAAQMQIQQMTQQIQEMGQQLQMAGQQIQTKQLEIDSKEKIEMMKLEQNTVVELAKINHKAAETLFAAELQRINQQLEQIQNQSLSGSGNQAANPNDGVM